MNDKDKAVHDENAADSPANITCSKSIIIRPEKGVKYVQSQQ